MPNLIDQDFISEREGGSVTTGYVPAVTVSKSGVTIATGFDLGARNALDLATLGLSPSLRALLTPYCGKRGQDAADSIDDAPLTITDDQAGEIDIAVRRRAIDALRHAYKTAPGNTKHLDLFDLPAEAQTVIASVAFQYGNLHVRTPKFWRAVTAGDWSSAVKILRHFGDKYPKRRGLEADLLQRIVSVLERRR